VIHEDLLRIWDDGRHHFLSGLPLPSPHLPNLSLRCVERRCSDWPKDHQGMNLRVL
jgi:hypothetical protein